VVSSLQGRAPPLPPPFRRLCMDTAANPLLPVRCYGLEMGRRYRSSAVAAADECGQCHVVSVRSCWTRTSFMCKCTGSLCLLLRPKSQTLVWYQSPWPNKYTKCLKPHFRSIVQSHWQMQKNFFCIFSRWQLYCPKLWRHSQRICFVCICFSESSGDLVWERKIKWPVVLIFFVCLILDTTCDWETSGLGKQSSLS